MANDARKQSTATVEERKQAPVDVEAAPKEASAQELLEQQAPQSSLPADREEVEARSADVEEPVVAVLKRDPDFKPVVDGEAWDGPVKASWAGSHTYEQADEHGRIEFDSDTAIEVTAPQAREADGVAGVIAEAKS